MTTPTVVDRPATPYLSIKAVVTMQQLGTDLPPLAPELIGWMWQNGLSPTGPIFWKYNVIDMDHELEVEVGAPVGHEAQAKADGRVQAGELPAGRYVTVRHVGHPEGLYGATRDILAWADQEGLTWDSHPSPEGERWVSRLEIYESNPDEEPDMDKWQTVLAFKLAD